MARYTSHFCSKFSTVIKVLIFIKTVWDYSHVTVIGALINFNKYILPGHYYLVLLTTMQENF